MTEHTTTELIKITQSLHGYELPLTCGECESQILSPEFFPGEDPKELHAQLGYRYFKCVNGHTVIVWNANTKRR